MELRGQRVAAHHHRQAYHHLDIVFVDRSHRAVADPPDCEPEQHAAPRLLQEQGTRMPDRQWFGTKRGFQQDREHDNTDAVVEQAFPGDGRLQRRRHIGAAKHAHDRNRIGRADERSEHQAPDQRHDEAQPTSDIVEAEADHRRREQDTPGTQPDDRPASTAHIVPFDVQGTREQQERQHAIHERRMEVDAGDEPDHLFADVAAGQEMIEADDKQRCDQAHNRQADRGR